MSETKYSDPKFRNAVSECSDINEMRNEVWQMLDHIEQLRKTVAGLAFLSTSIAGIVIFRLLDFGELTVIGDLFANLIAAAVALWTYRRV